MTNNFQFPIKWEYDTIAYRMAASKKELCTKTKKVPLSEEFEQHPKFKVYTENNYVTRPCKPQKVAELVQILLVLANL